VTARRARLLAAVAAPVALAALVAPPGLRAAPRRAAAATSAAACAPAAAPRGEWRSYGHDLANSRFQDAEHDIGPLEAATLAPVWTFSSVGGGGEGDFTGTPVVADGCVFVGSSRGWIFALNADTGRLVWKAKAPIGGIDASLTVDSGRVYAEVSNASRGTACTGPTCQGPYAMALSEATGATIWRSAPLDTQSGSDVYGSPALFDGMLFVGVSGGSAELGDASQRIAFHGSFVLLDAATGAILTKTWTIPRSDWSKGFAGAGIWSTPAIDASTGTAFAGTGNPFSDQLASPRADAVLKIDLNRASPTFGQVTGVYQGQVDTYTPVAREMPCFKPHGNPPPYYPQGLGSCGDLDLDFGASPNLLHDPAGRLLVGEGQKSGAYHAFDPATMRSVWQTVVGPPSSVGGIVGSTAFDGYRVYGPITSPGYLWSLSRAGGPPQWLAPIGDGAHWGNPVAVASGVVYTVDLRGFLDGYDAGHGVPVLQRPIVAGGQTGSSPVLSWGGVSIARGTVYAAVGLSSLADGFVVAFQPGGMPSSGGPGGPGGPPPAPPGVPAGTAVVAGPGAQYTTYATPVMVTRVGGPMSFVNNDLPQHDVTAVDRGADGLPLFHSKLIGIGEVAPVEGLNGLQPGRAYGFYCSIHPGMQGTLVVAP
jgi:polyvinyl alcohol dehydrogenase (cytochrome)